MNALRVISPCEQSVHSFDSCWCNSRKSFGLIHVLFLDVKRIDGCCLWMSWTVCCDEVSKTLKYVHQLEIKLSKNGPSDFLISATTFFSSYLFFLKETTEYLTKIPCRTHNSHNSLPVLDCRLYCTMYWCFNFEWTCIEADKQHSISPTGAFVPKLFLSLLVISVHPC